MKNLLPLVVVLASVLSTHAACITISPGELKSGSITAPNQTDCYTFTASSGDVVNLAVVITSGPGQYPVLELHGPDNDQIFSHYDNSYRASEEALPLTQSGTYTLLVRDDTLTESFGYILTLFKVNGGNLTEPGDGNVVSETIVPGQFTGGAITAADTDRYTFTASSGDVVNLALVITNGPGQYPVLQLYGPDNNQIFSHYDNSYRASDEARTLTQSGTYTLLVRDDTLTESFGYTLTLFKVNGGNLTESGDGNVVSESIVPGQFTGGAITVADIDRYTFTASSGDVVNLTLVITNGPGQYPVLQLYDPDNKVIFSRYDNSYRASDEARTLTQSGTYTLLVRDDTLTESFGYTLTLFKVNGGNLTEPGDGNVVSESIVPGQFIGGAITVADTDRYTFTASSGDVVNLTLVITSGPGQYPVLQLYDPDNNVIFSQYDNSYRASEEALPLTQSGTYTLLVRDDTLTESFGYTLTLFKVNGGNLTEPGDGNVVSESIVPGQFTGGAITVADTDRYTFTASSGDVVNLALVVTNGPGQYPVLQLYDPDNNVIFSRYDNNYRASDEARTLTQSGTYTLLVRDDTLTESFGYTLTLFKVNGGNLTEPGDGNVVSESIVPGQFTGGAITVADTDRYTFTASSGDVVNLALVITNGPGQYPVLQLYDPDNNVIFSRYDNNYRASDEARTLTQSGTYTLLVRDDTLTESFGYTLTLFKVNGGNLTEPGDGNVVSESIVPGQFTGGAITVADTDRYTFTASSGDVVNLALVITNGPGQYPVLQLYGPDNNVIFSRYDNSYRASDEARTLTQSGTYTLLVRDDTLTESFGYTLNFIRIPGPNLTDAGDGDWLLSSGETRAASIVPGDLDAFGFSAIAGDTITVTVRKASGVGLYPILLVYAPDGTVLPAAVSTPTSARLQFTCMTSQTGDHVVVVRDDTVSEAFAYTLTVVLNPGPPPSYNPDQPYLAIFPCMGHTVVRWPTNAARFQLQTGTNPISGSWSTIPPPYSVIANHYYVTNTGPDPARFYRLLR